MKKFTQKLTLKAFVAAENAKKRAKNILVSENGDADWTNMAIKIIIGVVLGALFLFILYNIINTTVKTNLEQSVEDFFTYNGGTN